MGAEDNGPNAGELAQRMEELAHRVEELERENRVLREALDSGTSHRELERQQPPQATQANQRTLASTKTVRGLLLGPRDELAYSRPLAGVLPSYTVGLAADVCCWGLRSLHRVLGYRRAPQRWHRLAGAGPDSRFVFRRLWRHQRWQQVRLRAFLVRGAHHGDRDNGCGVCREPWDRALVLARGV